MSRYTTSIEDLINHFAYDNYNANLNWKITNALQYIFDFDYPIWDTNYKKTLERKIILRYFNKEIGLETPRLWKLYLEERMNSIMPYYNQLYKTVAVEYEWLSDINYIETFEGNKKVLENAIDNFIGKNTSSSTNTSNNKADEISNGNSTIKQKSLKSDYPQAPIGNIDYGTESVEDDRTDTIQNTNKMTNEQTDIGNNTNNSESNNIKDLNSNINDLYTRVKKGLTGNKSLTELNEQYRASLINIDNLIINELKDLFMMIY